MTDNLEMFLRHVVSWERWDPVLERKFLQHIKAGDYNPFDMIKANLHRVTVYDEAVWRVVYFLVLAFVSMDYSARKNIKTQHQYRELIYDSFTTVLVHTPEQDFVHHPVLTEVKFRLTLQVRKKNPVLVHFPFSFAAFERAKMRDRVMLIVSQLFGVFFTGSSIPKPWVEYVSIDTGDGKGYVPLVKIDCSGVVPQCYSRGASTDI